MRCKCCNQEKEIELMFKGYSVCSKCWELHCNKVIDLNIRLINKRLK